ncbi:MAG: VWA domain-containing protein [Sphingobacteriales bacterium]|nr:MAG: VWA domain-containing protein [Sphingobacteriales bacterium]
MRFSRLILVFLVFFFNTGLAQVSPNAKQPRILVLVDGSSSMLNSWQKTDDRFKAAGLIVEKLIDSIYSVNDQVEFALRVYGHQHPAQENNCVDTKTEVRFTKKNKTQMELRMASLHPRGVSPIAYSIKQAAENDMLDPDNNTYSLILITDGGESCGGDICAVARELLEKKISFKPYILSLVDHAPLRQQYECLGEYILVTKPGDIPSMVGKIVDSYRPMLAMAKIDPKLLQTAIAAAPSPLKVKSPAFKVAVETEKAPEPPKPQVPEPAPLPKTEISNLALAQSRQFPQMFVIQAFRPVALPPARIPVAEAEPPIVTTIAVTTPAPSGPTRLVIPNTNKGEAPKLEAPKTEAPKQVPPKAEAPKPEVPKPVAPKPEVAKPVKPTPKPTVATSAKPVVEPEPKPKEATFTVDREDAKETTLEVYLTNGKGKFYKTTPQLLLLDAKTGKPVSKFYRTTDASGNPDPQKQITPGIYNLTVASKSNLVVKNVEIKEFARNKVNIIVGKASLIFTYQGNLKRPVNEYVAIVNRRFEAGPTIRQQCTQELEYEPGNYYIEVNTLPIFKRNLDLEFDYTYDLQIPEDGFVNFTNTNAVGKVRLYMPLGDQFLQFHALTVPGNADGQKLKLQPGTYEAHFIKNPNLPLQDDTVIRFNVKSNQITDLELQ